MDCARWSRSLFFFFQAEDGIRDDLVTGVQTCALPISRLRRRTSGGGGGRMRRVTRPGPIALLLAIAWLAQVTGTVRSAAQPVQPTCGAATPAAATASPPSRADSGSPVPADAAVLRPVA